MFEQVKLKQTIWDWEANIRALLKCKFIQDKIWIPEVKQMCSDYWLGTWKCIEKLMKFKCFDLHPRQEMYSSKTHLSQGHHLSGRHVREMSEQIGVSLAAQDIQTEQNWLFWGCDTVMVNKICTKVLLHHTRMSSSGYNTSVQSGLNVIRTWIHSALRWTQTR